MQELDLKSEKIHYWRRWMCYKSIPLMTVAAVR